MAQEANDRIKEWVSTHEVAEAPKKRDPLIRQQHLTMTARWYLEGVPLAEIARRNDVTTTTVQNDLNEIRAAWHRTMVKDYNTLINQQLTRLDDIEQENWEQWHASKQATTRVRKEARTSRLGTTTMAQETSEQRFADSAYMATIRWCVEERSKLLGLYAAVKLDVTNRESETLRDRDAGEAKLASIITRFIETGHVTEEPARIVDGTATEIAS